MDIRLVIEIIGAVILVGGIVFNGYKNYIIESNCISTLKRKMESVESIIPTLLTKGDFDKIAGELTRQMSTGWNKFDLLDRECRQYWKEIGELNAVQGKEIAQHTKDIDESKGKIDGMIKEMFEGLRQINTSLVELKRNGNGGKKRG